MHTDSKKQPRSKRDVAPTTTQKTLLVVAHKKEGGSFFKVDAVEEARGYLASL